MAGKVPVITGSAVPRPQPPTQNAVPRLQPGTPTSVPMTRPIRPVNDEETRSVLEGIQQSLTKMVMTANLTVKCTYRNETRKLTLKKPVTLTDLRSAINEHYDGKHFNIFFMLPNLEVSKEMLDNHRRGPNRHDSRSKKLRSNIITAISILYRVEINALYCVACCNMINTCSMYLVDDTDRKPGRSRRCVQIAREQ
jgi:hypothetical protein